MMEPLIGNQLSTRTRIPRTTPQTLKAIRTDLIAQCRLAEPELEAVPEPVTDDETRRYPEECFAQRLLAPTLVDEQPASAPSPTTSPTTKPRRRKRAWIMGVLILAASAATSCLMINSLHLAPQVLSMPRDEESAQPAAPLLSRVVSIPMAPLELIVDDSLMSAPSGPVELCAPALRASGAPARKKHVERPAQAAAEPPPAPAISEEPSFAPLFDAPAAIPSVMTPSAEPSRIELVD